MRRLARHFGAVLIASIAVAILPVVGASAAPSATKAPRLQAAHRGTAPAPFLALKGPSDGADPAGGAPPSGSKRSAPRASGTFSTGLALLGPAWASAGPRPITAMSTYGPVSGRITSIAVDPTNQNHLYAGSAGGGVWHSTDGGLNWSPSSDETSEPSLAIGALAVDPGNGNVVYAGTGEANRCGDCQPGRGILKSTDGGLTWTDLDAGEFTGHFVESLVVDRTNSSHVIAGTSVGVAFSNDGGSTWQWPTGGRIDSLLQDPSNSAKWWLTYTQRCSGPGGVATSTDNGVNWSVAFDFGTLGGPKIDRAGLGVGPGGVAYVSLASCGSTTSSPGSLVGIWKSTDSGASWGQLHPTGLTDYFAVDRGFYGWYNNVVSVDPGNASRAVFGGTTALATSDGGASVIDIARPYSGGPVHPDFHALTFGAAGALYAGTDGGVWKSADLGGTGTASDWSDDSGTLGLTTFYGGDAIDTNHMVGGAQDEGTSAVGYLGATVPGWASEALGDGVAVAIDPSSNFAWGEAFYGDVYRFDRTVGRSSIVSASPCATNTDPACSDYASPRTPLVMDPSQPGHLYAAGQHVYRSTTGGVPAGSGGWTQISPDLTSGTSRLSSPDVITALAPFDGGNTIAAGTEAGKVEVTFDGNDPTPTWTDITPASGPFAFNASKAYHSWIDGLAISCSVPCNAQSMVLWATSGAYGTKARIAFYTGGGWAVQDPGFSDDVGVNGVTLSRDGAWAFFATDLGVTALPVGTQTFWQLGSGLPDVEVDQVTETVDGSAIVAWTHGRGAWTLPYHAVAQVSPSSIDFQNVSIGDTTPQAPITLTNGGLKPLAVSNVSLSGANVRDFQRSGSCTSVRYVALGDSCVVNVDSAPLDSGPLSASLDFTDNSADSPQHVALSANGVRPVAALSGSSIDLGTVEVGVPANATVTVSNQGPGRLITSAPLLTGTSAAQMGPFGSCFPGYPYSVGGEMATDPGSTCLAGVQVTATAAGSLSATLSWTDNTSGGTQTVTVVGTAVAPSVTLSTTSLSFPDQTVNTRSAATFVYITNHGPGPMVWMPGGGPSITGDTSDFGLDADQSCANLAVSATCSIRVVFQPTTTGNRTATIALGDNASDAPQHIALSGNGIPSPAQFSPAALDFGTVVAGNGPYGLVETLTNTGTAALNVSSVQRLFSSTFVITSDSCTGASLAHSASCQVTVAWTPGSATLDSDYLQFTDSAPDSPQLIHVTGNARPPSLSVTPTQLDFGEVKLGGTSAPHVVTFTNNEASASAPITSAFLSGGQVAFALPVDGCSGVTLAPHASCSVEVTFTPSGTGPDGEQLILDYTGVSLVVPVSGRGINPGITADRTSIQFGDSQIGMNRSATVILSSTGTTPLSITAVNLVGSPEYAIANDGCSGQSLAPSATCQVTVSLATATVGAIDGTLEIDDNAANQLLPLHAVGGYLYYFSWYDHASDNNFVTGTDEIHAVNVGSGTASVQVQIPGIPACDLAGTIAVGQHQSWSCSSGFGGPVVVFSSQPLDATQRVKYAGSFNETRAEPATAPATSLVFTWFDRISDQSFLAGRDDVHVLNPGDLIANVSVHIPGSPACDATVAIAPGADRLFQCATGFGGPVTVNSDQPVLGSQRVKYGPSFNEVAATPTSPGTTHLVYTWYDRISDVGFTSDDIHVYNPGNSIATIDVHIPGHPACDYLAQPVAAHTDAFFNCASGFGGPVTVDSDVPVIGSQRVKYYSSFNEVAAVPASAGAGTQTFDYYDSATPGVNADNIHVVNPGTAPAHVHVAIPGCVIQSGTIAAGAEAMYNCPGGIGGPVTVSADQPVLASQRVKFYQSFNEVPAF